MSLNTYIGRVFYGTNAAKFDNVMLNEDAKEVENRPVMLGDNILDRNLLTGSRSKSG